MELMLAGGLALIILFVVVVSVSTVVSTVGSGIIEEEDAEED